MYHVAVRLCALIIFDLPELSVSIQGSATLSTEELLLLNLI